jgi:4-hydroxy-tetrahydrodipicolinate reductase
MTIKPDAATVKIVIAGVNGRMGRASVAAIANESGLALVGAFGRAGAAYVGKDVAELGAMDVSGKLGILVSNGFHDALAGVNPDVLLDFTHAEVAVENAKAALQRGIRPVIGTSGITKEQVKELTELAKQTNLGAMIVPNFSVGAVLMMEFARQAAVMFDNAEIVEIHHTGKKDAPSGTAMHTLEKMALAGKEFNKSDIEETELLRGARGGQGNSGLRVHSLRLPGLISHQEVLFGGEGELLTIKHDSFNTKCFVKGIVLAIKSVMKLDRLVVGLDAVLPQAETA